MHCTDCDHLRREKYTPTGHRQRGYVVFPGHTDFETADTEHLTPYPLGHTFQRQV